MPSESQFHFSPRPNRAHEIRWRPWGAAAFEEAAREDRPILLAISAVWCHWCHVMDETSYSDQEVIRLLNQDFVPVRVDNDERPDVNARYNMGGWPTTAFLTPDGEALAGMTYVPPEQLWQALTQVRDYYREHRGEVAAKVAERWERRREAQAETAQAPPGDLSDRIVEETLAAVREQYDPVFGGFGGETKFPHVDAIDLLTHAGVRLGDAGLLQMAQNTLRHMAAGGTFDQVWGGFFRYSTRRDWSVPHFEKMLEDNAGLLRSLVRLHGVAGDPLLREAALRTIGYVDAWLSDPGTGVFYGSQDADEEFYRLDGESRQRRSAPPVDHRVYAGWLAQAASAYLEASWAIDRPELAGRAARALDWMWQRMWSAGEGLRHVWSGEPAVPGVFADHAFAARALLDAYEVTGERMHLDRALEVAAHMALRFQDAARGGFWDVAPGGEVLGRLAFRQKQIGENAVAATVFARLGRLLDDARHTAIARRTLEAFAGQQKALGLFAAGYALAVDEFLNPGPDIRVVDRAGAGERLHGAALRVAEPGRVAQLLDPGRDADLLARLALPAEPAPAAYICIGSACGAPVSDASELTQAVAALREAAASFRAPRP